MKLQDIMTRDVVTVDAGEPLQKARTLMSLHGIHHLVVVEGRKVAGIVTDDRVRWGEAQDVGYVQDVMLRQPVTAPPTTTVREAANLMRGRAVSVLPVVDHRDYLIGVVTISDFLDLIGKGTVKPEAKPPRRPVRHRNVRPKARAAAMR